MSENVIEIIENITENIKKSIHCYKCQKIIYKKFGTYKICQDCRYELSKKYYQEVIKPNREKKIYPKKTIQLDFITTSGTIIKVNVKSENKICKKCNELKNY